MFNKRRQTRRQFMQKTLLAGGALCAMPLPNSIANVTSGIEADIPERGFFSLFPAKRWEEALLIGNGKMGGLVMSQPYDETITLTHERLFMPIANEGPTVDTGAHLQEIRQYITSSKYREAASLVMKVDKEQGRNGKVWTDPFFSACDLQISLTGKSKDISYRRSLDFATGLARVQWANQNSYYQQRSFISRPDNTMVLELEATGEKKLSGNILINMHPHKFKKGDKWNYSLEETLHNPIIHAEDQSVVFRVGYKNTNGGYEVVARFVPFGGKIQAKDGSIHIDNMSKLMVLLRIEPLDDFNHTMVAKSQKDLQELGSDFNTLLNRHIAVHGSIYNRQTIDLGGGADRLLPAEKLWQKTHNKTATPALLERVYDAGRYQILCSCGDWPPNLKEFGQEPGK